MASKRRPQISFLILLLGIFSDLKHIKSASNRFLIQISLVLSFVIFNDLQLLNTKIYLLDKLLSNEIFSNLTEDNLSWESKPLLDLVKIEQLMAFKHEGFWQAMDTLRDKNRLNELWDRGMAPWKIWE